MRREVHVRFGEERQGDSFDYALSLTPLRVKGRWCYLYRAIDSKGATIDFLLSALRDADAAKRLSDQHRPGTDLQLRDLRH
jgi:IS6 family transposase